MKHGAFFLTVYCLSALLLSRLAPQGFGTIDFLQYWSAAHLFLVQGNPYNELTLYAYQQPVIATAPFPLYEMYLWLPPFALPLLAVLGLFSFALAAPLWGGLSLVAWTMIANPVRYQDHPSKRWLMILMLSFYPALSTLFYGQIDLLLALAVALWFTLRRSSDPIRQTLSGVFLGLTACKPQLLMLLYVALLVQAFSSRRWYEPVGFLLSLTALSALSWAWIPDIFTWYTSALEHPPLYWANASLASLLYGHYHVAWLRFAPLVFATIALSLASIMGKIKFSENRSLGCLAVLSIVVSPYVWIHDFTLLLPLLTLITSRPGMLLLTALNAALWFGTATAQHHYWWFPLALLAIVTFESGHIRRRRHT